MNNGISLSPLLSNDDITMWSENVSSEVFGFQENIKRIQSITLEFREM